MNKAQQQFGEPNDFIRAKVQPVMDEIVRDFIGRSPFVVMATANARGDCDASPKGGRPGFVHIVDERTLLVPDLSGNKLFQSCENIETNPRAAFIFMIPGCGLTVRVNGRVRIVDREAMLAAGVTGEVFDADDRFKMLQGLRLDVDEVYPHCPRAFVFSQLWDTATISENARQYPDSYWYRRWARAEAAPATGGGSD